MTNQEPAAGRQRRKTSIVRKLGAILGIIVSLIALFYFVLMLTR